MPTGYTEPVRSGEVTTFEEYAIRCARAFGALVTMRDEPTDAEIPESFEPSDHHAKALEAAKTELEFLEVASDEACELMAYDEYKKRMADWRNGRLRRATDRERYVAMLSKVKSWSPPSKDHDNFKAFMESQLKESIDFDCDEGAHPAPQQMSGAEWKAQRKHELEWHVEYHTREHQEEIERVEQRNRWIKQLRESLQPVKT